MADMRVVTVRLDNENKVIIIKSMWSNRYLSILLLVWLLAVMQTQSVVCNSSFPYDYNSACFQQCPWNDTQVTYLLNGTTQCSTTCANGTFADDSTKKCVVTCPTAPIQTYYDLTFWRCVQNCSADPQMFAHNLTCVSQCPSPTYGDALLGTCVASCSLSTYFMVYNITRLCVSKCYPNFYANSTRYCIAAAECPATPVPTFADDSTGLCVQVCPKTLGTFADSTSRRCVLYCPLGSFADPTTQVCVSTCPSIPDYFGSNITRNCLLLCNRGEFANPRTRQCVQICPSGLFGDYSTRRCVQNCPTSQGTYADPLTNLCVAICAANYYADDSTRTCVQAMYCSNNTFGDPIMQKCVQPNECSTGLYVDVDLGVCVFRCSGWANTETGFCESGCNWIPPSQYFYKDPSTHICVEQCPTNPRSFGDPTTRTCESECTVGLLADPSTLLCVQSCPDGYFANNLTRQCVATCTQNTTTLLYFHRPTLVCLTKCPEGYFADNSTMGCESTCLNNTYGYPPTSQCLSGCPVGWFADNYTYQCVESCPLLTGQYADPSTNLCVDVCPSNPDYYGQDINDGNKTCVSACSISGFYADPLTRTCVYKCNSTAGYFGHSDGRCYLRCPTGYGNPLNQQCVAVCPRVPRFFFGDNTTAQCVLACPSQTYGDTNNNLCVTARNCTSGLFGNAATGRCVAVCSKLLSLFADPVLKLCVRDCSFPYYADPTTQACGLTCSSGFFRDNSTGKCVRTCASLPDYYGDPNSGFCEYNCTASWFAYSLGTLRRCVSLCPSPFLADLTNFMCVSQCANGTYAFTNNSFRGCLTSCPPQVFNASLQIDLFADNTTWKCVVVCPYGYYSFAHPNDSSIRLCVKACKIVNSQYFYAEDSKRECVTKCPLLSQGTYGDKINFRCTSVCSRNQYKDNSTATCVYRCPNTTYANNVTWNCSATCSQGYFAEDVNNTCVRSCAGGLYGYNRRCVSQCPNNTLQYSDNSTWLCVTGCPAYPAYFADNNSVSCVLKCPQDYYADEYTRTCVLPINCTEPTVADPISRRCVLQCPQDPVSFLTPQLNLCGPTCSNGTFAYNQTNLCVSDCPAPYFGVNSSAPFYCVQYCPPLQYQWVNLTTRICLTACPQGTFRDNLTMVCLDTCSDYTYANSSNNLCVVSCAPLYADDSTKSCVEICPNGTTASNNSYKCQSFCDYGQYSLDKVCLSGCPANLFADNLTRKCLSGCPYSPLTYADSTNRTCVLNCSAGLYAYLGNYTCVSTCPSGLFKELTLLLCLDKCLEDYYSDDVTKSCITSCNQTSSRPFADPTTQACVATCPSLPDLFGYLGQCLTQCPPGFFAENFTRTCVSYCPNVSSTYLNASWADSLTRRCLQRCSALSYSFTNSTDNVCLNTCPVGFYASIADQACLLQCPSGTFAHVNSTTCVDQCPPGQWADLVLRICKSNCVYNTSLFADNSSAACVDKCPTYPDLFADKVAQKCVLSCPNGTYAYNVTRVCESTCPSPYFADPYKLQCVLGCLIADLSYADTIDRKCVSSCSNHTINGTSVIFYADNSTLTCVRQCPELPNKLYAENTTNTCMQSCPSGTYGDNDTRVCLDRCVFQLPKFTWADKINNFCVKTCPYSYFADNSTGSCELTCANGTFADQSSRRCVINCPINPASYSTIVGGVGVCVYNCPSGTFSSEVSISCVTKCPQSPVVYYSYSPTNACVKECTFPYYADSALQACTQNCKVGFYGNKTLKSCQACQVQCVTCTGYLVCTSCITGFYLYQSVCVVSCPTYPVLYFSHKLSGVCYDACPQPYFGESSTGNCQLTCAALKYQNTVTRICTACPTGCVLCNSVGCSSCTDGYTFLPSALECNKNCNATAKYYFNSLCYTSCPAGSYLSYDLVHCLACSSPCATCIGAAGNCTSCIGSYYYLGQCLNACPTNFYIDSNLNCVACSLNPQKCTLPPLTYTVTPFTANYQLQAYVVFNRAVTMTLDQFKATVQITANKQTISSSQYTASIFNSTTYLVVFSKSLSLNENSLSFSFTPGSITDQYGNILTTVTVQQNITMITGITEEVVKTAQPVEQATFALTLYLLLVIGMLLLKNSYPALIGIEALQLLHLHIFLFWNPLPYLEYKFLDALKSINLMFIPSIFSPLNLNNSYYVTFTSDVSFLSNSPIIVFLLIIIGIYFLVALLSSKRFVSNKHIRKVFKRVRKYRVKYGLIHDALWIVYPYAVFISLLQFKMGGIGSSSAMLNIGLAAITFIILNGFAFYVLRLAHRYRESPGKIPKKFAFIQLEPANNTLQMPARYARKLAFGLALLLPSIQSQLVGLLAVNLSFIVIYLCYRPSKNPLNNSVCLLLEVLMVILEGVCYAYDKLLNKTVSSQNGFAAGMLVLQGAIVLTVLIWLTYRLVLAIQASDSWKIVYQRVTRNTDPEYLKEQQRKRDLEYDFGGLDVQSQDERTDHVLQKLTAKKQINDEKFNIFDQDDREQFDQGPVDLEKPFKMSEAKRPSSMDSSEKLAIKSVSSQARLFEPNKSANNYRRRNHLEIRDKDVQNSVEEVLIDAGVTAKGEKGKVLWEDIDFDQEEI